MPAEEVHTAERSVGTTALVINSSHPCILRVFTTQNFNKNGLSVVTVPFTSVSAYTDLFSLPLQWVNYMVCKALCTEEGNRLFSNKNRFSVGIQLLHLFLSIAVRGSWRRRAWYWIYFSRASHKKSNSLTSSTRGIRCNTLTAQGYFAYYRVCNALQFKIFQRLLWVVSPPNQLILKQIGTTNGPPFFWPLRAEFGLTIHPKS